MHRSHPMRAHGLRADAPSAAPSAAPKGNPNGASHRGAPHIAHTRGARRPQPTAWRRFGLTGLLGLLSVSGPAWAATVPPLPSQGVAPAHGAARVALQREGLDESPPSLQRFAADGQAVAGGPLAVRLKARDDLSGVSAVAATAVDAAGHSFAFQTSLAFPRTAVDTPVGLALSPYLPAGDYRFVTVHLYDHAGNVSSYDADALAALGRTTVRVSNRGQTDAQAPTLLRGRVLTPTLSLTATHPGTHQPAFAGAAVRLADNGDQVTAGVRSVDLQFCRLDAAVCFWIWAGQAIPGRAQDELVAGYLPAAYTTEPGVYHLAAAWLQDHAGNLRQMRSTAFGGETDFGPLFDTTAITLTP